MKALIEKMPFGLHERVIAVFTDGVINEHICNWARVNKGDLQLSNPDVTIGLHVNVSTYTEKAKIVVTGSNGEYKSFEIVEIKPEF